MVSLEHFPKIAHPHLRVERRGLKVAVTEELLDVPDISPSREQVGGTGMAERMGMERMGEPGRVLVGPEKSTNHASTESSSSQCDEESFFSGIVQEKRTHLAEETLEGVQTTARNGKQTIFSSFSVANPNFSGFEIHVGNIQPHALLEAHRGAVEHFQQSAVPYADGCRRRGGFEKALDLRLAEDRARQSSWAWKTNPGRWVAQDDAAFVEKGKESPDDGDIGALGKRRQRCAPSRFASAEIAHERHHVLWGDASYVVEPFFS